MEHGEDDNGPCIALVRFEGDEIISFGLSPSCKRIDIFKTRSKQTSENPITDMNAVIEELDFQLTLGINIPTGDELAILEEFLLPG